MKHEHTEHEEKRNNGANSPFQLGEADRKHIAGIGVDVPCAIVQLGRLGAPPVKNSDMVTDSINCHLLRRT